MAINVSQLFSFIFFLLFANAKPSPFEFLKNLQGSRKGEKIEGLHQLKQYLTKFGYLNHQKHSQLQTFDHVDDHFDDILESAIKTYQLNYHLKATGSLDAETVSKMMMPRCGVSDIINGNSRMRAAARKKMHHHGTDHAHKSLIHEVSHYTFYQGLPRWPADKSVLTYKFEPGTPENTTSAIARAFDKWASATHFTFINIQDTASSSTVADIRIGFHSRDHGDGYAFDGPYGVLAHASPPTSGSFHLDADEPWSIGPSARGSIDLETVALHEIGHLLGLEHSSVKDAIMYPSISDGMTKGLHGDDIIGIKTLYTTL